MKKKKSNGKNPAFLIYGMDFMRDMAPHPPEIRGVWISVMCTVCFSKTPGTATMTLEQWSRIFGTSIEKTVDHLAYLKTENIGDISEFNGEQNERITITSRRMVRDTQLREIRRKCGKLGWKVKSNLLRQNESKNNSNLYQKTETENENETKEKSLKEKGGMGEKERLFETFWSIYPSRNGKKLYRQEALKKFCELSTDEITLCLQAVKNYAISSMVKQGMGIKDPHRFLWNGKERSWFWKEWIEPERNEKRPIGSDNYDKPI